MFPLPSTILRSPFRSSHWACSLKIGVLENFSKFTGKHLCNFIKKGLWHRCFPVDFEEILRRPILENISRRLLLSIILTVTISLYVNNIARKNRKVTQYLEKIILLSCLYTFIVAVDFHSHTHMPMINVIFTAS